MVDVSAVSEVNFGRKKMRKTVVSREVNKDGLISREDFVLRDPAVFMHKLC